MVDAVCSALNSMGFKNVEIVVAKTGWPYKGDDNDVGPSIGNAKVGDRIAQLILEKIVTPDIMEVDDLDAIVRAVGGFGSIGLAWKHSIDVGASIIDANYRGHVGVILFNYSDVDFEVKVGDRIAQLILEKIVTPDVMEVEDFDETMRGV
ncbi:hypothetical protein POTOM_047357 [Populus tomentosa]|uniref:Deoxyuridine 5'-triphosphate nucleotidohydrolase n=1 Tax=Populus tomentosa TaxID=118781 RepID=A0A8X8CDC4_POPTO|nr:hypothetical protein POTOM_047357 [Populus tomentosa]